MKNGSGKNKRYDTIESAEAKFKIALDTFLEAQRICRTAPSEVQEQLGFCHDKTLEIVQHILNIKAYLDDE